MIIGPNPTLAPLRASEVGVALRRALRRAAGERRNEIGEVGAGNLSIDAELLATLDPDFAAVGLAPSDMAVIDAVRGDLDVLAGFTDPAEVTDRPLAPGQTDPATAAAEAARIAAEAAQAQADRDAFAADLAAAQVQHVPTPAEPTEPVAGNAIDEEAAAAGAPPAAVPPVPDAEPAPAAPAGIDFGDREQFPNIDALRDFGAKHDPAVTLAGLSRRGDIEAALSAAVNTPTQ